MDAFDNYTACQHLTAFVDALSNWFVRLSRDRFWSSEHSRDKADAYWTLYECLLTLSKLIAPFTPFLAETIWQNLAVATFADRPSAERPPESVHLCDYPKPDANRIDQQLSERMALAREVVSLGRSARMGAKLKVRQPLSLVEVVLVDDAHQPWLEEHASLICDELNVKRVEFTKKAEQYITYTVLPDLKRLGPRLGKRLPTVKKILSEADGGRLLSQMETEGHITLMLSEGPITLDGDDIQVRLQAKPGWAAAQGHAVVVVLSTELTPELIREGIARDFVRALQETRKELGFQFTDRIDVTYHTTSMELSNAVSQFIDYIKSETLSVQLGFEQNPVKIEAGAMAENVQSRITDVAGETVALWVRCAAS
jgi:isoleucyl-tRNA synthetase